MRCILIVVVSLLVVVEGAQQREAAVQAQATVGAVREIVDALAPELVEALVGADIDDMSGKSKVPVVGKIKWSLKNIKVASASFKQLKVDLPGKVLFEISQMTVIVNMKWKFKKSGFPGVPFGDGRAKVTVSRSDISAAISLGEQNGRPTARIDRIDVRLRDVKMKITGSFFSWLYNWLLSIFNKQVKRALQSAIEESVTDSLNTYMEEMLASFPTTFPVLDNVVLDYSLTKAPRFVTNPNSVVLSLLGEFRDPNSNEPAPFPHVDFNENEPLPRMTRFWLDQFLFNSFLYTAYKTDLIDVTLRDGDPVDIGFGFNTNDWLLLIPRLPLRYPNRELILEITAAEQPLVQITEAQMELDSKLFVRFLVEASGDPENPRFEEVFVLRADGDAAVEAAFMSTPDDTRLLLKLSRAKFKISLESSDIGNFDVTVLNAFIRAVFDEVVIPMVNQILEEGLELPQMDGLTYRNSDIHFHEGFLALDTDLAYTIPKQVHASVKQKITQRRLQIAASKNDSVEAVEFS